MWSLGCILFEILHLKPAFRARDKETLFKKVNKGYFGKVSSNYSEDFGNILTLLLETNPYERISCSIYVTNKRNY
jgi:serine/threonine protein kinase